MGACKCKKDISDENKDLEMEDCPRLSEWVQSIISYVLIRGSRGRCDRQKRNRPAATEMEGRVMQLQVKDCGEPPEAGRGKYWILRTFR